MPLAIPQAVQDRVTVHAQRIRDRATEDNVTTLQDAGFHDAAAFLRSVRAYRPGQV